MTKTEQKDGKRDMLTAIFSRLGAEGQSDANQWTLLNTSIHFLCYKHEASAYKLRKWRYMESAIKYSNQKPNYRQFLKFIYK